MSQSSIEIVIDNNSGKDDDAAPEYMGEVSDHWSDLEYYTKSYIIHIFCQKWTILDVHFGAPLFDVDCNTRICENIVQKLCTESK